MLKFNWLLTIAIALLCFGCKEKLQENIDPNLKVVIIRHAEKPEKGDNLSCQGQNRALALAKVLQQKIGIPDYIYVPSLDLDIATKHCRMFQTISPFAVKYNLPINSKFDEKDIRKVAKNVLDKSGIVLVVWNHSEIPELIMQLGIKHAKTWENNDFDSIWLISYKTGKAELSIEKEGLIPSPSCNF
jgi:hypothetical protein